MALITEVIAPPLSSLVMVKTSPLIAFITATAVEFSAILALFLVPETLLLSAARYERIPDLPVNVVSGDEDDEMDTAEPKHNLLKRISHKVNQMFTSIKLAGQTVAGDWTLILTLPCFLTTEMGTELVTYIIQYTSKRF